MKLHKIIKQTLTEQSQESVIIQMGYSSLKVGCKTLKAFLNTKNVYEWLKEGHYDLKYASEPFIWKLVEVLNIPLDIAREDIEKAKKRYRTLSEMKPVYLRAEINFRRKGEFIFALMFASAKGRIAIHQESLVYQSDEDTFQRVEKLIRKHYAEYKAELPILGKITHYLYSHSDGNTYSFSAEGELLNDTESKNKKQT
jgi:disulfide oxidoreductase YuzD